MNLELSAKEIGQRILFIRGQKVMLDSDLAELYGVPTKQLNLAVRRNTIRFPGDFMFLLTVKEYASLRIQSETLKIGRGKHRKYLPFVFTEQGVAMLSGVLHSDRAIHVNLAIMRTFVRLREVIESNKDLAKKLNEIERKLLRHDHDFKSVFEAIRQLVATGLLTAQCKLFWSAWGRSSESRNA